MEDIRYQSNMLAYCGLYCEQCSFKRAHDDGDAKHLQSLPYPAVLKPLSEYGCDGCKGEHCRCTVCKIKPCIIEKGYDSCADCESFPCELIEAFGNDGIPHHAQAMENLRQIRAKGYERWFDGHKASLRCGKCGERASWYYSCEKHAVHVK